MQIYLIETQTGKAVPALILEAKKQDMPLKKDGWNFTWKDLYKNKDAVFYKLVLEATPDVVEGVIMISIQNEEMVYLNNVELAPHNIGTDKRYDYVAGCLIAYGCLYSHRNGVGHYKGFVCFDSKTALINHYRTKYGAEQLMGQRMFIAPITGIELIKKYLNEDLESEL